MAIRLDQRLRRQQPDLSWTRIRDAIAKGQVVVDGRVERDPATAVDEASEVVFDPSRRALPRARLELTRLHEDAEILVIDKPAGLLTIPSGPGRAAVEDTVLARAQTYARHLHGRRGYAGVLHRLDRDTSGALAIALTPQAHRAGRALFGAHAFERWYLAVVQGVPDPPSGIIDMAIADSYVAGRRRVARREDEGRHALTRYAVRETYTGAALLEIELETGRQHQIRLHLQRLGHPLLGERVYADHPGPARVPRQMLHAWRLAFPHPIDGQRIAVEAPMPADMAALCRDLARRTPRRGRPKPL